jgi:two-component system chemotaxis sensor kinase CheA
MNQDVRGSLNERIDAIAEQMMLGDLTDHSVLGELLDAFQVLADSLADEFPRGRMAATMAAERIAHGIRNGGLADASDHQFLTEITSSFQVFVAQGLQESAFHMPESATSELDSQSARAQDEQSHWTLVDAEIMAEYISHQESVVAEIEDLILKFEDERDLGSITELKRLLHTAKGEAGVVGLMTIEKLCHLVEDFIQDSGDALSVDPLLEFKDWFEQVIAALRGQQDLPSSEALRARLVVQSAPAAPAVGVFIPEEIAMDPTLQADIDILLQTVSIEDPEITADFVAETMEHFEISDENLLTLENDPENEEAIASIFRAFHTIKGTTSFLGLMPISRFAHVAENLLDEVRKKRLAFSGIVVDATFNALDALKSMTRQLETSLANGTAFTPDSALTQVFLQLKHAIQNGPPYVTDPPGLASNPAIPTSSSVLTGGSTQEILRNLDAPPEARPESSRPQQPANETRPAGQSLSSDLRTPADNGTAGGKVIKQTMKIDADRIDLLLETIGELVIIESIVSQKAQVEGDGQSLELERNLAQLTKITRSLQDMGMSMRLIPIDNTFRKMSRLVRDLAQKSDKRIELHMEGKDTELDKGMVEKLGDPLVHMIRNAVDHGIEASAQERIAAGKNPVGTITLRAYHQGGGIHIEIADDGRGLDREAILRKGIERGLITNPESMTDEDIFGLIFASGFSTAARVTDVSGRGVGMDVVRSNIESLRGNVRIASVKGVGTTFTLILPLTMAIIDGMIVKVGSDRYILPLLSIIESFKPTDQMVSSIHGAGESIPFRNHMLPFFRLHRLFGIPGAKTRPSEGLVVVLEDAGRQIALMVDELLGQNQTVIKTLGTGINSVEGIAGASIMPDGNPGLIVDVNGLFRLAMS